MSELTERLRTVIPSEELLKEAADYIEELEAEMDTALKDLQAHRAGHTATVEYNLSPAMKESAIRNKLIELGWTPPANAS